MDIRGIYVWDGDHLVRHRRDFRKIGARLFRKVKADTTAKGVLQSLANQYGVTSTLKDVLAKCTDAPIKDKYIPATAQELKDYEKAEATLQAHVDRTIESRNMQLARNVVVKMYQALATLKKMGVLVPEHPMPINLPKNVSAAHVEKLIAERRQKASAAQKGGKTRAKAVSHQKSGTRAHANADDRTW